MQTQVGELVLDMSNSSTFTLPPLDKEYQEKVIEYNGSHICVIAGPATGKTRIVYAFVIKLLNEGYLPEDILLVTFTKTGRDVMNDRLGGLVQAWTLHQHGFRASRGNRQGFLKTMDFDELLGPRKPSEKFYEWAICDEGQDLTPRQYERLISLGKRILIVGDPWQSLYSYPEAGADPTLLNKFCKDFGAKEFPLGLNHRSKENIVKIGNTFSGRNMEWEKGEGLVHIGWEEPSLDNLTILTRTNKRVLEWAESLKLRGIPYTKIVDIKIGKGRQTFNWDGKGEEIEVGKESGTEILPILICTIHCSKGDEWSRVLLDYRRESFMDDTVLEERVFYVGLTRAKEELFIMPEYGPFIRRIHG